MRHEHWRLLQEKKKTLHWLEVFSTKTNFDFLHQMLRKHFVPISFSRHVALIRIYLQTHLKQAWIYVQNGMIKRFEY